MSEISREFLKEKHIPLQNYLAILWQFLSVYFVSLICFVPLPGNQVRWYDRSGWLGACSDHRADCERRSSRDRHPWNLQIRKHVCREV